GVVPHVGVDVIIFLGHCFPSPLLDPLPQMALHTRVDGEKRCPVEQMRQRAGPVHTTEHGLGRLHGTGGNQPATCHEPTQCYQRRRLSARRRRKGRRAASSATAPSSLL